MATSNHQAAAETTREPAGRAFERLSVELAQARQELAEGTERRAAEADGLQAEAAELQTEMARLAARLAAVQQELATRAEQAAQAEQDGQQKCRPLERELEELKPRLGYEFNLPQDASLVVIGQLGVVRCLAARACRGLRAAVGSARDLGEFRHRVLALTAGNMHSVVCTGDAVFSFGDGSAGQLGYETENYLEEAPESESDDEPTLHWIGQATPRVVTGLLAEDVVAAAASRRSTLVHTAEGRAYWFGKLYKPGRCMAESQVARVAGGLERVVGVAAGDDHLLAWTGSGELYTWGVGASGRLGHGGAGNEAGPRLVEGLAGQQVVGADGGKLHSVACTASGRVYTFGRSREQLGHGQDAAQEQLTPRLVEGLAGSTVVAVAAGNDITAAVTETGELYTWGINPYGALGHGRGLENTEVDMPRLVAGLAGRRVAGVAAGYAHTLAWADSGELYSWGEAFRSRLGNTSEQDGWSPRRVEGLAGKVVVGAAAFDHSVVMTRDQQVYTFGAGDDGRLGHGSTESEFTPRQVAGLKIF